MPLPARTCLALCLVATVLSALIGGSCAFHRASAFNSNLKVVAPEELAAYALPISFAQFSVLPPAFHDVEGYAVTAEPVDGCTPLANAEAAQDAVVIVVRGGCEFYTKAKNVEDAGGIAFVISNEQDSFLPMPTWGANGPHRTIPIPGGIVYGEDGAVLRKLIDGGVPVRLRLSGPHLVGSDAP